MQTDTAIQTLFKSISTIRWRSYESNPRIRWYYAEDNCYVVNDTKTNALWLISAKSPVKACERVISQLEGGNE